jgi:uncharacterized membrane protein YsdA (DUF1294 family)
VSETLRFTPTEADLKAAYSLHMARVSVKRLLLMAAFGLVVGLVVAVLTNTRDTQEALFIVIMMLCWALVVTLAIYLATRYLWMPRYVRRIYAQQKDLQGETEVSWDATGFATANANGRVLVPWADFHQWQLSDAMLLLYRSDAMFNFLPLAKPAFAQAASEMVDHLQAAGVKRR